MGLGRMRLQIEIGQAECEKHKRKLYKGYYCADCNAEKHAKNVNTKGTIYYCDGKYYWWYDNGFHYKIDRIKYSKESGLELRYVPEWASVCNYKTEEHIKENCLPIFKATGD